MKIHVRRRHIEKGKVSHHSECPIALAFKELTGKRAHVGGISLTYNLRRYFLPRPAISFIACFDAGLPVKPFAFVLK